MPHLPRQCAILVGGLGSRLGHLTQDTPKPLLDIGGRPFLAWLMREALRWGIEEFILLTGYLADRLAAELDELASILPRPVSIRTSCEPSPLGTGGALHHARAILDDRFLLLNGDSLLLGNLGPALAAFSRDTAETACRMILRTIPHTCRYGVATLSGDRVTAFCEQQDQNGPGLINAGVYLMDRQVADKAGPTGSLERDVLPRLAEAGALRGTIAEGWFIDIGVPEDLHRARIELPQRVRRPALFLDRDGVLNRDHGWVGSLARWEWMPGAIEAVRLATSAGWHVFVVTNQSGVARGLYTEDDVRALHGWMADTLRQAGGTVDDIRYCPFHPDATLPHYRRESGWRKPKPGMILDLIRAWQLAPQTCLLVGDHARDVMAAEAAGIIGHLFEGLDLEQFLRPLLDNDIL